MAHWRILQRIIGYGIARNVFIPRAWIQINATVLLKSFRNSLVTLIRFLLKLIVKVIRCNNRKCTICDLVITTCYNHNTVYLPSAFTLALSLARLIDSHSEPSKNPTPNKMPEVIKAVWNPKLSASNSPLDRSRVSDTSEGWKGIW